MSEQPVMTVMTEGATPTWVDIWGRTWATCSPNKGLAPFQLLYKIVVCRTVIQKQAYCLGQTPTSFQLSNLYVCLDVAFGSTSPGPKPVVYLYAEECSVHLLCLNVSSETLPFLVSIVRLTCFRIFSQSIEKNKRTNDNGLWWREGVLSLVTVPMVWIPPPH